MHKLFGQTKPVNKDDNNYLLAKLIREERREENCENPHLSKKIHVVYVGIL